MQRLPSSSWVPALKALPSRSGTPLPRPGSAGWHPRNLWGGLERCLHSLVYYTLINLDLSLLLEPLLSGCHERGEDHVLLRIEQLVLYPLAGFLKRVAHVGILAADHRRNHVGVAAFSLDGLAGDLAGIQLVDRRARFLGYQ